MPKSKFLKLLLYLFLLFVVLSGVWTAVNFIGTSVSLGQPAIARATEITGIEYPVDDNGDLEYLKLINAKQMISVKVDNNAVVPIVRNCDPKILDLHPDSFFFLLGIARPDKEGQKFEPATNWLSNNVLEQPKRGAPRGSTARKNSAPSAAQFVEFATNNPWTDDELPELVRWLEAMAEPINAFAKASERDKFYLPTVVSDSENARFFNVRKELIWYFKELGPVFKIQANRCLGNEDYEGWLENIDTIYRFGSLVSKGNSIPHQLVALGLHRLGDEAIVSAAAGGKLNAEQLHELLKKLTDMRPINGMASSIRHGERLLGLDFISQCAREGSRALIGPGNRPSLHKSILLSAADYNHCLEMMNADFEQVAKITELPENEIQQAANDFDSAMEARDRKHSNVMTSAMAFLAGRSAKGKYVGDQFSLMMMPAPQAFAESILRRSTIRTMTKLAIQLELYKLKNGNYPDRLDELVPEFVAKIDNDLYSGSPFSYQLNDGKYVLYSWGSNGQDDLGPAGESPKSLRDISLSQTRFQRWQEFLDAAAAE